MSETKIYNLADTAKAVEANENIELELKNSILANFKALENYMTLEANNQILRTNLPIGTLVYFCVPIDGEIDDDLFDPVFEQKIFAPSTVFFYGIQYGVGKNVFTEFIDAVKYFTDKLGAEKCAYYNLPYYDSQADKIITNGFVNIESFKAVDKGIENLNIEYTEAPPDSLMDQYNQWLKTSNEIPDIQTVSESEPEFESEGETE